ncbi:MAG: hypothetical protein ACHQFX_04660 [Chitinophagales bacterium]
MKRIAQHSRLLLSLLLAVFSLTSFSQEVTGIWKGYFISDDGQHYRLEFQVKQNSKGEVAVSGVSYSWQDDIQFYGKATMTGSFIKTSKNFRIKEIKTVEVKSATGYGTCIMNYNLVYSRSGKEEFLEGTYLGKQEVKGRVNTYEWGDCGGGRVYLRRVTTSDFYVEPFLRKKNTVTVPPSTKDSTVKKTPPPITRKPTVTAKRNPVEKPPTKPSTTKSNPPAKTDTAVKLNPPTTKITSKPVINVPTVLKVRSNELMKSLVVNDEDVVVKLYDNGEIDDDTISIYYDKKLLLSSQRLSGTPITVRLKIEDDEIHELVMVAENLGRIPPNTSLMIVDSGEQRFDVRITSTAQKNALVRFRYEKPK